VVIDAFTKFTKLYATKTLTSKESIECLKQHFANYSRPHTIVSDRGTSFTSSEFEEFLKDNNIRYVLIATASEWTGRAHKPYIKSTSCENS